VLGWVLAGIYAQPVFRNTWIFKGGTCLKKCYFETYRFSEDLDFTLTDARHLDSTFLMQHFNAIAEWVYEHSGIEIPSDTLRFDIYTNPRGGNSCNGKFGYRGPIAPGGSLPRIKLDITTDEVLVLEPVVVPVNHPYSDNDEDLFNIKAYCFDEVFAEKIRALAERLRPRDLYDVINLYRQTDFSSKRSTIRKTLRDKCAFKGIGYPSYESIRTMPERNELVSEWANMLAHQLRELPPFDHFWKALNDFFLWLEGTHSLKALGSISTSGSRPPTESSMGTTYRLRPEIETIRFAAANRLCVDLRYDGSVRRIEPYSVRRTSEGKILLYAVRAESGEIRAYRVDRIQGATVTHTPFIPRFLVELSTQRSLSIPPATRRSPTRSTTSRVRSTRSKSKRK